MAKVKLRVLYPSAFLAMGVDTEGKDEVSVESDIADSLVAAGWAESIKAEPAKEPETKPKSTARKAR